MRLHRYFTDSSVIQRGRPFTVKGFEAVGKVTVCFGGKEYSAVTENGAFAVVCPPQSGSFEPVAFTVRDGSGETLKFTAFFGDVFLCAGQSNMEYCIEGLDDRDDVLAACAEAKGIYFLNTYGTLSDGVALVRSATPLADFVGEVRWQPIFDESAKYLSAVAAIVALKLIKRADTPIGLVCNPVGGVQICAYLPRRIWSAGSITGGAAEVAVGTGGLRVVGTPAQREYFYFGASPLIDLCCNPHGLQQFTSLKVCMIRRSGDAHFCGFLVRGGGFVYRFEPKEIEWDGTRKVFDVDLLNARAGDGNSAENDREILRTAHAAELYFRGREKTEILIEWIMPVP